MSRTTKLILGLIALAIVGFIVIQFIPMGSVIPSLKDPGNPPVEQQITWDSPQTEQLARTACFDCHSNETRYPWYASIAPVKWLVYHDINEGRDRMNFSTWQMREFDVDTMIDLIQKGEMPKAVYLPMHPEARLSEAQKAQLIAGFEATFNGG